MPDLNIKIRQIKALLATTVERGAFPAEAENAQRLAKELITRHGLEALFDDHRTEAIREAWHADPVRAAAERFWQAMRDAGASDEAIKRERAKWERQRTSKARRPTEQGFERAKEEWDRARAEWDTVKDGPNPTDDYPGYRAQAAKNGWATRRQRRREERLKQYKGRHGTVSAVIKLGGAVTAKRLASWLGITEDAAHGRLWRAQMAGLLKKTADGIYIVAT